VALTGRLGPRAAGLSSLGYIPPPTHVAPAPAPVLTLLQPDTGPAQVGMVVAARGTDFVDGAVFKTDGVARLTTFIDETHVRAQVGFETAGTWQCLVTNPDGQSSNVLPFVAYTSEERTA